MEKRQTQIRLPSSLFEEIKRQARESNRSLNGQLVELVQLGLKAGRKEEAKAGSH
ncbi:Arc family DNA-binding protein [Candidatus Thiothrix sp. Deng01]|uniref:Arc family DNA-binding protein n=1 Tax=Candidatus Thiothrix phosphatis TaxID=3112415 RepID=A0ABU6CV89_9GAMM|nr:Arc family DNA-binding protein [Candidatus Thiothrix sp. Deng01]MEB4590044.1 Arc family DNA-binding protein [Candidatus Thiothrix sp. Deng01]